MRTFHRSQSSVPSSTLPGNGPRWRWRVLPETVGGGMSGLAQIQTALQRYLLTRERDIETLVQGTARVPVPVRLGIYADGYRLRLAEALQTNFPVLARLLGEAQFARIAAD